MTLTKDDAAYIFENVGVNLVMTKDDVAYVYEGDVNTDPPTPELWTVVPGSGRPGDGVVLWGFGLGDTQATYDGVVELLIDGVWTPASVIDWDTEPAGPHAYDDDRALVPYAPLATMEHQRVTITIPGGAIPPGHSVRVVTTT